MSKAYSPSLGGRLRTGIFAIIGALCLLCITVTATFASTVNIYDNAGVLNQSQVRSEASSLSYPIDIYTTNSFTGSKSGFDQTTAGKINKSNLIVIAIDTAHRHLAIVGGRGVSLSNSQYTDARNAFSSNFHNNDYTSATLAAIDSLRSASGNGVSVPGIGGSSGGGIGFGALCCVGLLVLAAVAVFGIIRVRRRGGGFFNRGFNRGPVAPPYGPNYNQYNQNQGINPLAAGGLGAAAGGLLGYELGKEQGEREGDRGGDGGDFGGGSSGDFGGGNNDGGGFGGGSSGDFGGGGDSGGDFGGGGGGDFGGGSSGDF